MKFNLTSAFVCFVVYVVLLVITAFAFSVFGIDQKNGILLQFTIFPILAYVIGIVVYRTMSRTAQKETLQQPISFRRAVKASLFGLRISAIIFFGLSFLVVGGLFLVFFGCALGLSKSSVYC